MAKLTRGERREQKKRRRMPVSGKHVFTIQRILTQGTGQHGKKGRRTVRASHRTRKPRRS